VYHLRPASLFNLLIYRADGSWPTALSLIPFLAQGRALYIVLVYKTESDEVSVCGGMAVTRVTHVFLIGVCLGLVSDTH
jgi:hypothetical protein